MSEKKKKIKLDSKLIKKGKKKKEKKSVRDEKLIAKYNDPEAKGSLGGVKRFAEAQKISLKKARRLLEKDLSYSLHKPRRQRFPTIPVVAEGVDHQWVADLVEVQRLAKYNNGNRYLLMVIDVLSKHAWVQPMKAKTGVALVKAFGKILKESGRKPIQLQTDLGKEFYNRTFQAFLKKENIHHFSTSGDAKASVVERFNRTFKSRLYRYFTAANTLKFVNVLQALVKGYNESKHRSIGMAPTEVTLKNEREVWDRLYGTKKKKFKRPKFKVGDRVRLNKKHRTFKKSYLPGWTEEVFRVKEVRKGPVPTYKIQEWDETPLEGTFYEQDLQKVQMDDEGLFRIEKILKRKEGKSLVQWKGWPEKYNTWIPSEYIRKV